MLGLTACGLIPKPSPSPLEIPVRDELRAPCERVAIPQENQLPALAQGEAGEAQVLERRFWSGYVVQMNGAMRRLCSQRDEAVSLIANHAELVRSRED